MAAPVGAEAGAKPGASADSVAADGAIAEGSADAMVGTALGALRAEGASAGAGTDSVAAMGAACTHIQPELLRRSSVPGTLRFSL